MRDQTYNGEWVDRYLRNELSAEDEASFETALLESTELQQELETTMALRDILQRASKSESASEESKSPPTILGTSSGWRPMALAASILLAVFSTVMWWKSGNDLATVEKQLQALGQPFSEVLTVAVPIMRSGGGQTPDVIVQLPDGRTAILLDIELGMQAREEEQLIFRLVDEQAASMLAWQSAPSANGRASAVIPNEHIPASKLWLQISDTSGTELERRLLEFRESPLQ